MIEGPAVVSFSGGRTSGLMLRMLLDMGLGPDVHVIFCNTGREHPQTLDFVNEVSNRWDVDIVWLEYWRQRYPRYRTDRAEARQRAIVEAAGAEYMEPGEEPGFRVVCHRTASRGGEPFENLINLSGLPNFGVPFCSTELKTRVVKRYMVSKGYDFWDSYVGIRADEGWRRAKMRDNAQRAGERWDVVAPLVDAGITERDVFDFWLGPGRVPGDGAGELPQGFDLGLGQEEGNCLFCFKKRPDRLVSLARKYPTELQWAKAQEERTRSAWNRSLGPLSWVDRALRQGSLPFFEEVLPCSCTD